MPMSGQIKETYLSKKKKDDSSLLLYIGFILQLYAQQDFSPAGKGPFLAVPEFTIWTVMDDLPIPEEITNNCSWENSVLWLAKYESHASPVVHPKKNTDCRRGVVAQK